MAEFDRLAETYDESIGAASLDELDAIGKSLYSRKCKTVLDVGVGTGRISRVLEEYDFLPVGVDVSLPMILKAKSKGLENLVLADAKYLPFREKVFDATILVDVLNCLDDPVAVFSQIGRVTSDAIVAIKRKYNRTRESSEDNDDPKFARLRQRVAKFRLGSENGFPNSWEREERIIELYPPLESRVVSDCIIEASAESVISRFERGAFRFTSGISEDELRIIAGELRHEMQGSSFRRRRIREIHVWDAEETFPAIGDYGLSPCRVETRLAPENEASTIICASNVGPLKPAPFPEILPLVNRAP